MLGKLFFVKNFYTKHLEFEKKVYFYINNVYFINYNYLKHNPKITFIWDFLYPTSYRTLIKPLIKLPIIKFFFLKLYAINLSPKEW